MFEQNKVLFQALESSFLGLYPIVSNTDQLARLLNAKSDLALKLVQLRIKNKQGEPLEKEIQRSVELAGHFTTRLIINDHWPLAIKYRAYGVHLGQDDLLTANLSAIKQSGLRLGLSAYTDSELARANALGPSYIGYGPIFATQSKRMLVKPKGLAQLKRVRQQVTCPLVAIGGIGLDQLMAVLSCQVDGVAVISAINQAIDPMIAARAFIRKIDDFNLSKTKGYTHGT